MPCRDSLIASCLEMNSGPVAQGFLHSLLQWVMIERLYKSTEMENARKKYFGCERLLDGETSRVSFPCDTGGVSLPVSCDLPMMMTLLCAILSSSGSSGRNRDRFGLNPALTETLRQHHEHSSQQAMFERCSTQVMGRRKLRQRKEGQKGILLL